MTRLVQVSGPENTHGGSVEGFESPTSGSSTSCPSRSTGWGIQANFTVVHPHGVDNKPPAYRQRFRERPTPGCPTTSRSTPSRGCPSTRSTSSARVPREGPLGRADRLQLAVQSSWSRRSIAAVYLPVWSRGAGLPRRLTSATRSTTTSRSTSKGPTLLNTPDGPGPAGQRRDKAGVPMAPNAWFQNDRRIQVGVRLKY